MRGLGALVAIGAAAACSSGAAGPVVSAPTADASSPSPGDGNILEAATRRGKSAGSVFVHLFEWRWTDIAHECKAFLGPQGFAAVQVSPPSEHAVLPGLPWWQRYQTVSYGLDGSRSGTREEFVRMVLDCAAAGVDIYVDAVINHMTSQVSGTGSHGTPFRKYEYPGLYTTTDFHRPTCTIADTDYQDSADRVRNCELFGLADLNTGDAGVRAKIASYLIELVKLGVRGFRIDAAKHMAPAELDLILSEVAAAVGSLDTPYYFLEVIDNGREAISASDYLEVGRASRSTVDMTEFRYDTVGAAFLGEGGRQLSGLKDLGNALMASERTVVFTNNHDTQRAAATFYQDGPVHELANIFLLGFPYGYPSIMSSYAFNRATGPGRDQGPPSDGSGRTEQVTCWPGPGTPQLGSWVCEHRARAVANMVRFRRATAGFPSVTGWWDNGGNQIAFGRGSRGHVVINRENAPLDRTFETQMPEGNYCDVIGGDFAPSGCSGAVISVDGSGMARVSLAAMTALAIHVDAKLDSTWSSARAAPPLGDARSR